MSHRYPLARSATDALTGAEHDARSRAEAVALAEPAPVSGLETEWMTLTQDTAEEMISLIDVGVTSGFVQRYEDANGQPVLAVTYWKIIETETIADTPEPQPDPPSQPEEDHTDDLYFRSGRTKKRGRRKKVDPNQMDLFGAPGKDEV